MTEEEGKTKREEGCPGSVKRIISPPQESHNAKRPRTANLLSPTGGNLKVTTPAIGLLKTHNFSSDALEGHSRGTEVVFNDNKNKMMSLKTASCHSLGEQKKHQAGRDENEKDSGFTVITEQKTNGNTHTHLDTQPLTAHMYKTEETDVNKTEATRTGKKSLNGNNVTSNDQKQAGGKYSCHHITCLVCNCKYFYNKCLLAKLPQ